MQSESNAPVYFKYMALASSAAPSATTLLCVSALVVMASVPNPTAWPINSRFVLVAVPHVPDLSPVPISSNLKLLSWEISNYIIWCL